MIFAKTGRYLGICGKGYLIKMVNKLNQLPA